MQELNQKQFSKQNIIFGWLAFTIAAIPLMLSTGAGAGAREAVGTGLVGGMIAATLLAPLFIPMFFRLVAGISERMGGTKPDVQIAETQQESK